VEERRRHWQHGVGELGGLVERRVCRERES